MSFELTLKECLEPLNARMIGESTIFTGAKLWARRFAVPTVGITGSNGKTTVKEIVTSILKQQGSVLSTKGNLNNEIGVPLTLLGLRAGHDYAVIEMGANHTGEIGRLVAIAEPDVAVVTNIGTAHLEGFGSVEGIAKAKSEIYAGLKPGSYAVVNADDAYADYLRDTCSHCQIRQFGFTQDADVRGMPDANLVIETMGATLTPQFALAGEHNAMNALAAVAIAQCLHVQSDSIIRGLEAVTAVPGRLEKKVGAAGSSVIDDSYNANPDSVASAIKVLCAQPGKRLLVLGDMGELGTDSQAFHSRIGGFAREHGVDGLWTVGPLSAATQQGFRHFDHDKNQDMEADANRNSANVTDDKRVEPSGGHFDDQEQLLQDLKRHLTSDVTVLVKGSRSARMENVACALLAQTSNTSVPGVAS